MRLIEIPGDQAEGIFNQIVGENAILASRVEPLGAIDEEFLRWAARYAMRAREIYLEEYQEQWEEEEKSRVCEEA